MAVGCTEAGPLLKHFKHWRTATATLLLDSGFAIEEVQDLLGRSHITTTQIYDKCQRSTAESGVWGAMEQ